MCLYPKLIKNPKYKENKKNGGQVPAVSDVRVLYVPIGCGNCIECRKQKARNWQVRLLEDIKEHKNGKFITLTFSNESIRKLMVYIRDKSDDPFNVSEGYELDNDLATVAIRLFLERWRKRYKRSLRHWLVTELGHRGTENIHLHGIIWTDESMKTVKDIWNYGYVFPSERNTRNWVNEQTVNYIIKYVSKMDMQHQKYKSIVLCSPGIGKSYTDSVNAKKNKYKEGETEETYRTRTGHKIALPIYWRNKLYTDEEKERLWIEKLDREERWVMGTKVDVSNGMMEYYNALKEAQDKNMRLGYGRPRDKEGWNREVYEQERRKVLQIARLRREE